MSEPYPQPYYSDQTLESIGNPEAGIARLHLRRTYIENHPRHTLDLKIVADKFKLTAHELNAQLHAPKISLETWALNGDKTKEIRGDEYSISNTGNLISHENSRFNGYQWYHKGDKKIDNLQGLEKELKSMLNRTEVPYPLSIHPTILALMYQG